MSTLDLDIEKLKHRKLHPDLFVGVEVKQSLECPA